MDTPCAPAELYLRKLTASHFSTLNMKIANQNTLKMILIACTMRTRLIALRTSGYVQRNLLDLCIGGRLQKACRDADITITFFWSSPFWTTK